VEKKGRETLGIKEIRVEVKRNKTIYKE